jgi:pimeloyl-ACP methyl ester carboxylesterase
MDLTVRVDGGHLWADDSGGSGPALVLLHPGWGDSSIWLPMLEILAPRYRVIRYDTRGFGNSPAPVGPFTQLSDLIAVLDDRCVTDVMLVGHSGGGGTAIGLALAYPDRVRSLLLLAPGVQDYPWPVEDPYFTEVGKLFAAGDRDGVTALAVQTWAAGGADPAVQDQVRGATDALFRVGELERPDPPAYGLLGELRVPTAMVLGDRDYHVVIRCAEDIAARIPGCQHIAVPGADHMLPLRIPGQLADLIDRLDGSEDLPTTISLR